MSYPYLRAVHQTPGRVSVDFIAVHWMATTLAGCDATFTDGQRPASAHYGVENHVVHQYVYDENTAWALGDWEANQRSISVEHSAGPGRVATNETYVTSIKLIASLCRKYNLIPSRDTIRPHNHFQATQCPGTMDLDRIITGVKNLMYINPASTNGTGLFNMLTEKQQKEIYRELCTGAGQLATAKRAARAILDEPVDGFDSQGNPIRTTLRTKIKYMAPNHTELHTIVAGIQERIG